MKNIFTKSLGIAFLLQAITSLFSGIIFNKLIIENSISESMYNIAQNKINANISIFLDIITAVGIVWLGVLLFSLGKKVDSLLATIALALYILEAGILIVSKFFAYALVQISMVYSINGNDTLETIGETFLALKDFAAAIHIIPFGVGAIIFYYLVYRSSSIPSWIPIWGLTTVIIVLIVSPLRIYGVNIPFLVMVPYAPFEFFCGGYILMKGLARD